MTFSIVNFIILVGLSLDVFGAWYISRGLMRKNEDDLVKETGFSFAPNDNYIISGLSQKVECNVGFICLLFGFALQGLASLITEEFFRNDLTQPFAIIFILIVILFIIFFVTEYFIKRIIKSHIKNHVRKVVNEYLVSNKEKPMNILDIKRLLGYLGYFCSEDLNPEEAWEKLKDAIAY